MAVPISSLMVILTIVNFFTLAAHEFGSLSAILTIVDNLFLFLNNTLLTHSNNSITIQPIIPIKQQSFIAHMSVLFIGERNLGNYHSPYFSTGQEAANARHERKAKQDQYRLDLLHQMREKQDRVWKERNSDFIFSRRYQRPPPPSPLLTQHLDPYLRALSFQNKPADSFVQPYIQKIKERQAGLSYNTPSTPVGRSRVQSRLKTENLYERSHDLEQMVADLERRKEELERYDDRKIGEVYRKMHDSVRKMRTEQNEGDSLPLKNSFRERYRSLFGTQQPANPEQQTTPATYKLPAINRAVQSRQQPTSQKNWQQWYAKEKLRELQTYYKRLTIDSKSPPYQSPSPLTPSSRRRQYP